jgi:hypothetical protein
MNKKLMTNKVQIDVKKQTQNEPILTTQESFLNPAKDPILQNKPIFPSVALCTTIHHVLVFSARSLITVYITSFILCGYNIFSLCVLGGSVAIFFGCGQRPRRAVLWQKNKTNPNPISSDSWGPGFLCSWCFYKTKPNYTQSNLAGNLVYTPSFFWYCHQKQSFNKEITNDSNKASNEICLCGSNRVYGMGMSKKAAG